MHLATSHCLLFFLLPFSGHWLSAQQGMVLLRSVREGFRSPFWIAFMCCLLYCVTEYVDLEFTYKGQGFVSCSSEAQNPKVWRQHLARTFVLHHPMAKGIWGTAREVWRVRGLNSSISGSHSSLLRFWHEYICKSWLFMTSLPLVLVRVL